MPVPETLTELRAWIRGGGYVPQVPPSAECWPIDEAEVVIADALSRQLAEGAGDE